MFSAAESNAALAREVGDDSVVENVSGAPLDRSERGSSVRRYIPLVQPNNVSMSCRQADAASTTESIRDVGTAMTGTDTETQTDRGERASMVRRHIA